MAISSEDDVFRQVAASELDRLGWVAGSCRETIIPGGSIYLVDAVREGVSLRASAESPSRSWEDLIALARAEGNRPPTSGPLSESDAGEADAQELYRIAYDRADAIMEAARYDKVGRVSAAALVRSLGLEGRRDEVDVIRRAVEDAEIGRPPRW